MDILSSFGDLDDEISEKRKYAKWKAAYIHNCLKQGERPVPGAYGQQNDEGFIKLDDINHTDPADTDALIPGLPSVPDDINTTPLPPTNPVSPNITPGFPNLPSVPNMPGPNQPPMPGVNQPGIPGLHGYIPPVMPPTQPMHTPEPAYVPPVQPVVSNPVTPNGDVALNPEQIAKAQKYCKWASSALNYDDTKTAIVNLQKALTLLQTGRDSPE